MYLRYPELIIFTKLFTPRKFDTYMQLRCLRLWYLERDYGDLDKCLNCHSIGVLCNSQGGRGRGCGGGMGQYIFTIRKQLIRVQGYRGLTEKLKTVKTVHTLRYSVLKISEYFRGVVFCDSFGIYGAANLGIWCSASVHQFQLEYLECILPFN